jgi:rhamnogalacturonyl hydrolase YesR
MLAAFQRKAAFLHYKGRGNRMKLEFNRVEILETIDKIVKRTMEMDMNWEWPCGVAY